MTVETPEMKRTPLGMVYTVEGSGPPLVLVHGVCHSHEAWQDVTPHLNQDFTIYNVDLPGHGQSIHTPTDPAALRHFFLDVIQQLVDHIIEEHGQPPFIVGNSLGGFIALEAALQFPEEIRGAVAFSPAGFFHGRLDELRTFKQFKLLRLIGRIMHPVIPTMARFALGKTAIMGMFSGKPWNIPPEYIVRDAEGLLSNTVIDMAEQVDLSLTTNNSDGVPPMHCLWGTRDLTLIRGWTKHQDNLPQASLKLLPGLGHVPMFDDPELVAREIKAALL